MTAQNKINATETVSKAASAMKADMEKGATKAANTARDYVQRSTATAKERTDSAYQGVSRFNSGLEKTLNRLVTGYVGILGEVAGATHANTLHALSSIEKVSQAKTVSEAAQIHVDFVRESTTANLDRLRTAFEASRDVVTEGASTIRESVSEMMPANRKAA